MRSFTEIALPIDRPALLWQNPAMIKFQLDEGQEADLLRNLENYLIEQGIDPIDITGLEADEVFVREEPHEEAYKIRYSYEDRNDKIRRGFLFFSAFFHDNKLENVNFIQQER